MSDRLKGKRAVVTAAAAGAYDTEKQSRRSREEKHVRPPEGQARLRHRRRRRNRPRLCSGICARRGNRVRHRHRRKPGSPRSRRRHRRSGTGSTFARQREPSPPWPSAPARPTSCSTPPASCITAPCWIAPTRTGIFRSTSTSSRCTGRSSAFLPGMLEGGRGSNRQHLVCRRRVQGRANRYVYGATKAAVAALTRSVAARLHHQGHPLQLHLPRHHRDPLDARARRRRRPQRARDVHRAAADGPARHRRGNRFLAVYLASDESAFTTGVAHVIDGGWTL